MQGNDLLLAIPPLLAAAGREWLRPLVTAAIAFGLLGCARDAAKVSTLAARPLHRLTMERDLLEAIGPLPAGEAAGVQAAPPTDCVQRLRLEVPARAGLDLAAQAIRNEPGGPGPLGPLRLALMIDGAPVLEREVASPASELTLSEWVSLEAFAGRRVELSFEVCDAGPGNALIWAKRLWLTRSTELERQPAAAGPNLLFLVVDTLRADHLGAYGHRVATSPHLDRLAQEGLVFERAIASSSWTLPSVASLLTGRTPIEHEVIEGVALPLGHPTLAERMQAHGLTTYGFSSNPLVGRLEGAHRGFETFAQVPWARADEVNRSFLDWLAEHRGDRWFAYLHYIDPHAPYAAPAPHGELFTAGCSTQFADAGALDALSEAVNLGRGAASLDPGDVDCLRALYDGEIHFWDAELGALLAALESSRVLGDTVVVVTSDHGEEFLEHGHLLHGYQLYEESIRVPLVIWAPGRVMPGRLDHPVENRSLHASALQWMGFDAPDTVAAPLLDRGRGAVFAHTTETYVEPGGYTVLAAVREGRWKYVLRPVDGRSELFDLAADPAERANLSGVEPAVRGRLDGALRRWLAGGRPGALQARGVDRTSLERLRALGYIR